MTIVGKRIPHLEDPGYFGKYIPEPRAHYLLPEACYKNVVTHMWPWPDNGYPTNSGDAIVTWIYNRANKILRDGN